jgi:transcriptional antiterminator RfaH
MDFMPEGWGLPIESLPSRASSSDPADCGPAHVASASNDALDSKAWYCVRAKQKHEHIAGSHSLKQGIEVFVPRIRFRRKRITGAMWVTEPLFPGYFFARLKLCDFGAISGMPGVLHLVRFGLEYPIIPDAVIQELAAAVGHEILEMPDSMQPGDEVQILDGNFSGIMAIVKTVFPKQQRVDVLIRFLGSVATVRLTPDQVTKGNNVRQNLALLSNPLVLKKQHSSPRPL